MRIKAVIAYDGSAFEGFQRQTRTPRTVTTAFENALKRLGIESAITGSGRTDAGVHATGQVIHFDLPDYWHDLSKLQMHLNGQLEAIAVKHISSVPDNFHARFDAHKRIYRYLLSTTSPSVFERRYIAHVPALDIQKLQHALALFEGRHDFGYFRKSGSETKDDIRTIYQTRLRKIGKYYAIYFEANGFLRAQVRMMLSAAFEVSRGELTLEQLKEQLAMHHRYTTHLAPPEGLYLARVIYWHQHQGLKTKISKSLITL